MLRAVIPEVDVSHGAIPVGETGLWKSVRAENDLEQVRLDPFLPTCSYVIGLMAENRQDSDQFSQYQADI